MVIKEKMKMNKSGKRWESNTHAHTRYNLIKKEINRNYPFRVLLLCSRWVVFLCLMNNLWYSSIFRVGQDRPLRQILLIIHYSLKRYVGCRRPRRPALRKNYSEKCRGDFNRPHFEEFAINVGTCLDKSKRKK